MNQNKKKFSNLLTSKLVQGKGLPFYLTALCLVVIIGIFPSIASFAQTPTLDSEFTSLTVGSNQLKVEYYDGSQTMAGCFIAPEKAKYSFYVVNIGELGQKVYLLNNDFAEIKSKKTTALKTSKQYDFGTYILEKDEKIFFYAERYGKGTGTLASNFVITKEGEESSSEAEETPSPSPAIQETPSPTPGAQVTPVPSTTTEIRMSKTTCALEKGKKVTLKLLNNKEKILWVSANKKIATVSSKGVVKAKKHGTVYIYAIANHKLYECKVTVS